jgi:hypothetical protein
MSAKRACGGIVRRGGALTRSKNGAWRTCCITRDGRGYRMPSRPVPSALWCIHGQQTHHCRRCDGQWANELPIAIRHRRKLRPPRG